MSRTEGIHLPRLPGTPRQDIPHPVLSNAAMYDDVFDKEGRLLSGRNTAKFTSPLHTAGYNSLNDPHCRKLFLNNRRLRSHLINLGLITDDLKVVATTKEQRQKIRAHELLERKEMLAQKLEHREKDRLQRLCQPFNVPRGYQDSIARQEHRQMQWDRVQETKTKKILRLQEQERAERSRKLRQKKAELEAAMDEARLQEQAHRNALRAQQQMAEIRAYEKAYGKMAHWHREADKINNRMVAMKLEWAKRKQQSMLSQSFPPPSSSSRQSSQEDEKLKTLPTIHVQGATHDGDSGRSRSPAVTRGKKPSEGEAEGGKEGGKEEVGCEEIQESQDSITEITVVSEEMKATPTVAKEDETERETPLQTGFKPDEPVTRGSPLEFPPPPTPVELPAVVREPQGDIVAKGDQAKEVLATILIDALLSVEGEVGTGYMTVEDFLHILMSPDLGLQLEENEQTFIASQVDPDGGGVVAYREAASLVPDLLQQIFSLRAEQSMVYGYYAEEEWVQMYPVSGGVIYLNKLTGRLQRSRPEEYRPYLKDEVFEDTLVDFFETADSDRDGIISYQDFYNLLASSQVASRVYRGQMEDLLGLYQSLTVETGGQMDLALFPSVANPLLLMIYQNAYPDVDEWIELESKKYGVFWLNKATGEIVLQQQEDKDERLTEAVVGDGGALGDGSSLGSERTRKKSKSKKKRKHRKKSASDAESELLPDTLTTTHTESQPTNEGGSPPRNESLTQPITPVNEPSIEELVKPVSSRSRLLVPAVFETIPEEDETVLDDSIVAERGIGEGGEGKEEEGERYEQGEGEGERDDEKRDEIEKRQGEKEEDVLGTIEEEKEKERTTQAEERATASDDNNYVETEDKNRESKVAST